LPRITSTGSGQVSWPLLYAGVAFTTFGTLVVELSLTRIFSVILFYHFAFLAISIALFGLGAGGVFSYVVTGWSGNVFSKLGRLAVFNSVAVLASLIVLLNVTGEPTASVLALVYFAAAVPFFFSGAVVSIAISEAIERVERAYFFDLVGAAIGCLALIPFLDRLGGPNTVLTASVLFAVSAAIWYNMAGALRGRVGAVALALAFVVLIVYNGREHVIDVHYAKGRALPKEVFVQWNSFSRIGLERDDKVGAAIFIDADASTYIPPFDFDHLSDQQRFTLLHQGPGVPYLLKPDAKTLIIGPGGGWDVARALASGSKNITGVEVNPIIARTIMQRRFPDLSRGLYFLPDVHIFVEDGRSFVRRSTESYQLLQATLVDTWASTAAGAYALSENNLYTTEAFHDYLTHLTDDGLMAFTRWGLEPPRESLRLVSLAMQALRGLGEVEPWKHIVIVREDAGKLKGWGAQDTVIVYRKPISPDALDRARAALAETKLQVVYLPGDQAKNEFGALLTASDPEKFWRNYRFNVSPVSDDKPFFFYTVQPADVWNFLRQSGNAADSKINQALPLLFDLLVVSLLATLVVLALPPILLRARLPVDKGVRGCLLYFVFIGAAYIMIQVALIQKFVLFLGHPTYALSVIVFSMLISSGAGSYCSRRLIGAEQEGRLGAALIGVAVAVSALAVFVSPATEVGVGWPLAAKAIATAALIAPAGFLMGMPFPIGLTNLQSRFPHAVRWAWALNAAASVFGSACAIFLAIYIGLRATLFTGAALYVGALLVQARASARIGEPVAPRILSGAAIKTNS